MNSPHFHPSKSEDNGLRLISFDYKWVLSVGISTGLAAEIRMLKENNKLRVVATTLDRQGVEYAQQIVIANNLEDRLEVKFEDVSKPMPYKHSQFDYIYARLVLHYLDAGQLNQALRELYRVLKQNGKLFVVVRSTDCPDAKRETAKYDPATKLTSCITIDEKTGKKRTYSRYFHTINSITEQIVNAGFTIESSDQYEEQLYIDFERLVPSPEKDNVIEIVAVKNGR